MTTPIETQRFTYTKPITVGASSTGVGALVVFAGAQLGINFTPEIGAVIGGLLVTAGALLTTKGIKGIFSALWKGESA